MSAWAFPIPTGSRKGMPMFGRKKRLRQNGAVTWGTVLAVDLTGGDSPAWRTTVRYEVEGRIFEFRENLTVTRQAIKAGFLPVGQKVRPVMGALRAGDRVAVCYDPAKPSRACLRDNVGIATS